MAERLDNKHYAESESGQDINGVIEDAKSLVGKQE